MEHTRAFQFIQSAARVLARSDGLSLPTPVYFYLGILRLIKASPERIAPSASEHDQIQNEINQIQRTLTQRDIDPEAEKQRYTAVAKRTDMPDDRLGRFHDAFFARMEERTSGEELSAVVALDALLSERAIWLDGDGTNLPDIPKKTPPKPAVDPSPKPEPRPSSENKEKSAGKEFVMPAFDASEFNPDLFRIAGDGGEFGESSDEARLSGLSVEEDKGNADHNVERKKDDSPETESKPSDDSSEDDAPKPGARKCVDLFGAYREIRERYNKEHPDYNKDDDDDDDDNDGKRKPDDDR